MSNFMLKNRLFVKYLSGFDQNIAKLPWQCPFKGSPVFLPPQKLKFPNSNSNWNARSPLNEFLENSLVLRGQTNYIYILFRTPFIRVITLYRLVISYEHFPGGFLGNSFQYPLLLPFQPTQSND